MTPIIEAERLKKSYKRARALDGLDLVAESGRVLALLGPNGAGKTTFVRAVATLVKPDEGQLRVAGIDVVKEPARVREVIGLAGQYAAVEPAMTGRENLVMVGRLFGLDRAAAKHAAQRVLDHLDLGEHADRYVRTYSGGLRRRLDLGASLVGNPRLLLLDEPTTGLDPRSRNDLWNAIRRLVENGTDVLLTTQYLDEADQLATDVVIIDHGKVVASGTPAELKAKAGRDVIELHTSDPAKLDTVGRALATLARDEPRVDAPTRRVLVSVDNGTDRLTDAVRILDDLDIAVDDIALRRPTLDEVFLSLTGTEAS
jgi:daunorubicin resistance ABC transporter ATP-binding subunit